MVSAETTSYCSSKRTWRASEPHSPPLNLYDHDHRPGRASSVHAGASIPGQLTDFLEYRPARRAINNTVGRGKDLRRDASFKRLLGRY